jgi:hypothetical protein
MFPLVAGTDFPEETEFPQTYLELSVPGNETLPGGRGRNKWNRKKSRALLAAAGEEEDTASGADSESGDDELTATARMLRTRVAILMGITDSQLALSHQLLYVKLQ